MKLGATQNLTSAAVHARRLVFCTIRGFSKLYKPLNASLITLIMVSVTPRLFVVYSQYS
jgi:hypothetical protein